jgi:hypothetical protein
MKIKTALKTIAVAAALAFGAAHATPVPTNLYNTQAGMQDGFIDMGGMSINDAPMPFAVIDVTLWNMTNTLNSNQSFLAYCIQPDVAKTAQVYQAFHADTTDVSNKVRALYESSYKSTLGNADRQVAFQLALWELAADDGKLYDHGGGQYFSASGPFVDARVGIADSMLTEAAKITTLANTYQYTLFKSADGSPSQQLLSVTPVPEAETWAMLSVGLGLVGFMGRRKSKKSEQFAA